MNFNFPKDMQNDLKSNTKKPYTIVINSNNKSSGTNNSAIYNFDWFIMPDIPYNLSFAFVASDNNAYVAGTSPTANVYIDFGENCTAYNCLSNYNGASTISYIGSLRKMASSGANYYLYSEKITNPPIYFSGRPNNRSFQVRILTDAGANYDISMLGSYVLTLYFEPV